MGDRGRPGVPPGRGLADRPTLTGDVFAPQTITTTPTTFFFRVWAEGGNNQGYQTKMAATLPELGAVTLQEDIPVIDPTFDIATVPEIDPAGIGSVLALAGGVLGLLERRRRTA